MKLNFNNFFVPHFKKKLAIMLSAIILMGIFLSFLIEIGWGSDPFSYMNLNIASLLGWTLGNWQLLLNAILLVITAVFAWNLIGFGTIANMVLIGYTADFCCFIWNKTGLHEFIQSSGTAVHVLVFIPTIAGFVVVASIYMNAQMGLSPFDAVAKILSLKIKKVPFFAVRMCYDLTTVAIGFAAAMISGTGFQPALIGSIVMSLSLGPAITAVGKFMNAHILNFED